MILSGLLVAGGITLAASPAQAATTGSSTGVSGINSTILLLVDPDGGDASTTTLTRDNVTVTGYSRGSGPTGPFLNTGLFFAEPFSYGDSTVTPMWLFTTLNQYDATYSVAVMDTSGSVIQTITVLPPEGTTTGPLSGYPDAKFTLTQAPAGARTVALEAVVPNTEDVTESDFELAEFLFYAGFESNGTLGSLISDATDSGTFSVTSDATYITIRATMTFPTTSFGTRIVAAFLDEEASNVGEANFAAGTSVILSDSGGGGGGGDTGGGGGASTPATPSTDTGLGSSASEFTVVPFEPVVFADPAVVTAAEIAALTPEQVATIPAEQIRDLDPAAFAGFTAAQVRLMSTEQINAIRPARAAQLSIAAVTALSGGQLFNMRPASVAALKPEAIELLTAGQLASVRPEAFKLMGAEAINKIRPVQTVLLNAAQMRAFNQRQMSAMRVDTLRVLPEPLARALRPKQIKNFTDSQLIVFGETFGPTLRPRQESAVEFEISIRPNPDFVAIRFE